jgi:hypothetical protein
MTTTKRIELTDRDRLLLTQAYDDMLTVETAHCHYFAGQKVDAVYSTLRRLYGEEPGRGMLYPYPLDPSRKYYRLTRRAARMLGVSKHHTRPLNEVGKIQRYALSWLIHIDAPGRRTHFALEDHPEKFHLRKRHFPRHRFFIEEEGEAVRLGCAIVDHNATHRNAARKTVDALRRFLAHGCFELYFRASLFDVHLLTFTHERKRSLERLVRKMMDDRLPSPFAASDGQSPMNVRVRHVPGMKSLFLTEEDSTPENEKESIP